MAETMTTATGLESTGRLTLPPSKSKFNLNERFTRLMAGTSLPPHQQVIIRNPIPPSFFEASSRPFFDGASRNSVYTPFLRPSAVQTRVIPEEVNVSDDDDVKPDIRSSFVSTPIHTRLHSVFDNGDNNLKPSVRSRLSGGNLGQQPYVTPVRFPTPQATKFYHRQRRSIFQRLGVRGYGNYSRSFYNSNYGTRTRWRGGRRGFGFRWSGRSWGRYGPVRRSFICVDGLGEYRMDELIEGSALSCNEPQCTVHTARFLLACLTLLTQSTHKAYLSSSQT